MGYLRSGGIIQDHASSKKIKDVSFHLSGLHRKACKCDLHALYWLKNKPKNPNQPNTQRKTKSPHSWRLNILPPTPVVGKTEYTWSPTLLDNSQVKSHVRTTWETLVTYTFESAKGSEYNCCQCNSGNTLHSTLLNRNNAQKNRGFAQALSFAHYFLKGYPWEDRVTSINGHEVR